MYYRADPKEFITATPTKFELVYLLVDGRLAGTYVLASGVKHGDSEETALFVCADEFGNGIIWEALAEIPIIDDESVLNKIGYTTRLDKVYKEVID